MPRKKKHVPNNFQKFLESFCGMSQHPAHAALPVVQMGMTQKHPMYPATDAPTLAEGSRQLVMQQITEDQEFVPEIFFMLPGHRVRIFSLVMVPSGEFTLVGRVLSKMAREMPGLLGVLVIAEGCGKPYGGPDYCDSVLLHAEWAKPRGTRNLMLGLTRGGKDRKIVRVLYDEAVTPRLNQGKKVHGPLCNILFEEGV